MGRNKEYGSVLIVALIVTLVIAGFGVAYLQLVTSQSTQIASSVDDAETFQASLAGFDMSRCYLLGQFNANPNSWDEELQACVNNSNDTTSNNGTGLDDTIYNVGTNTGSFKWATNIDYHGSTYLATITNNNDGGGALNDTDDMVILTVTSTNAAGITVSQALNQGIVASVVQALVKYKPPVYEPDSAIVTGGSLNLGGNSEINGDQGSVYATGDVTIGGSAAVEQDVYTPGTITGEENVGGGSYPGSPSPDVPEIDPSAYIGQADYIFEPDGDVWQAVDGVKTVLEGTADGSTSVLGWKYDIGTSTWENAGAPADGTFYVEDGNIDLAGNIGSAGDPWQVTLLVNGISPTGQVTIRGTGNATMTPDTDSLSIMAANNINITGNLDVQDGLVATHEQVSISGNAHIEGSVVAEASTLGVFGIAVQGSGNCSVTYNGGMVTILEQGDEMVIIKGFRRIR